MSMYPPAKGRHIYLAGPYTHEDPAVREGRYRALTRVTAAFTQRGELVYSPVTYTHPWASITPGLPPDFEFWRAHCLGILRAWATELMVIKLPGWETSRGVKAEIDLATAMGLDVTYADPVFDDRIFEPLGR